VSRKAIVVLCLFLGANSWLPALDLTAGIKGGLNGSVYWGEGWGTLFSQVTTSILGDPEMPEYKFSCNFQAGVFVDFGVLDFLSFQTEAIFARVGELDQNKSGLFSWFSNFLEFNLVAKLRLTGTHGVTAFFFSGPDVLWRIEDASVISVMSPLLPAVGKWKLTDDDIKRTLWRILGGFGISIDIGRFVLTFDLRYAFPLGGVCPAASPYRDFVLSSAQLNLGVGYKIF
jgi:hypothetical protein